MVGVGRPLLPEISVHPFKNAEFQSIFARSAATRHEKSLIMTNSFIHSFIKSVHKEP